MSLHESDNNSFTGDPVQKQVMIVTQLMKAVPTMHSIDELFQWLAYTIIEHFDLQLIQFWTPFILMNGIPSTHLRTMVARNPLLPEQLVYDSSMIVAARHFAQEQRAISSQVVDALFPPNQTAALKHYGLKFCTGGFISSDVLLPLPGNQSVPAKGLAPFSLAALLFLSQRAHRDMMPSITIILKEAVELAINRSLLLPTLATEASSQADHQLPPLTALVLRRKEGDHLMLSDNPFARTSFILDKQSLRLYAAIDGKKSVARLCQSTAMDIKSFSAALHTLLKLGRVEMINTRGRVIDATVFFPENDS